MPVRLRFRATVLARQVTRLRRFPDDEERRFIEIRKERPSSAGISAMTVAGRTVTVAVPATTVAVSATTVAVSATTVAVPATTVAVPATTVAVPATTVAVPAMTVAVTAVTVAGSGMAMPRSVAGPPRMIPIRPPASVHRCHPRFPTRPTGPRRHARNIA
jgi:mediator of RNA polymerase II transcription subunit 4